MGEIDMAYGENLFTGMIDESGQIWDMATGRKGRPVGIDAQREQELLQQITDMQETLDSWRPKMIEHGYIQIPKTPEEIAEEQLRMAREQAAQQAEINQALLAAITSLRSQIGELKNHERSGRSNEPCDKPIGQTGQVPRKVTGTGKKRDDAGQKNASRVNGKSDG